MRAVPALWGSVPCTPLALRRLGRQPAGCVWWVHEGRDPIAERGTHRKAQSFDQVAEQFCERSTEPHTGWARMLATYASQVIGMLPVDQITTDHILKILSPIWHEKLDTAVSVRGRIEKVLEFAAYVLNQRNGDNPARWKALSVSLTPPKRVRQKAKVRHLPAMPYADVPAFLPTLRDRVELEARALEFRILTACRTGHLTGKPARKNTPAKPPLGWHHINLDEQTWTIPATKTDAEHVVPLSDPAVAVLKAIKDCGLPGERVFPMGKNDMWSLLAELAPGLTVHGFRASLKTWCDEETNVHSDMVENCLAHTIVGVVVERVL